MKIIAIAALLSVPFTAMGATVEITNVELNTSDGQIIRSGDTTGKMVPIVGGEKGRDVLHVLMQRSQNENLSKMDRAMAQVLTRILINRWYQISQSN